MSEGGDSYDPGPWQGYDYRSALATYDTGYSSSSAKSTKSTKSKSTTSASSSPKSAKKTLEDLVPDRISTNARTPITIVLDGTGSFGEKDVKLVLEKLPLLDLGVKDYFDDAEFSIMLVGDACGDDYPLQVRNFTKGKGLVDSIATLTVEGNGQGNAKESYDLAALYLARNCDMPKAIKPIVIFVCDEGIYENVSKDWAQEYARVDLEKNVSSRKIFEELKQKASVYCIRKHYNGQVSGDQMTGSNLSIHRQWEDYLGAGNVTVLDDPRRVVDLCLGVFATETDMRDFFDKEIADRQTAAQVKTIQKSMLTIGKKTPKGLLPPAGQSVLKTKAK
jgi:hypothetical protein